MEHRYYPRVDIRDNILLHVRNSIFVSGVSQNISHGGLSLKSSRMQCLKKNTLVRAAFKIDRGIMIVPSQIVRVGDDEVALMFIEHLSPRKHQFETWLKDAGCA